MTVFDRQDDQKLKVAIPIQSLSGAAHTGDNIIDTAGYKAAVIYIVAGTLADSTWTFQVEASDNSNMSSSVVASTTNGDLIEHNIRMDGSQSLSAPGTVATITDTPLTFAGAAGADSNKVRRAAYVGPHRYLRVDLVSGQAREEDTKKGGLTVTAAYFGAFIELLEPDVKPVVQD
jgi:hypothetical protein